jgi:hypothetical protein
VKYENKKSDRERELGRAVVLSHTFFSFLNTSCNTHTHTHRDQLQEEKKRAPKARSSSSSKKKKKRRGGNQPSGGQAVFCDSCFALSLAEAKCTRCIRKKGKQ